ncbi:EAL domain-containing protein [Aquabacterium fontiphilum]|uniref:bifunctional diguanylate cyclase/phosphodiesterase n=1 Tax=Aquabacterium fontiphilum TaxID=450365 RepID=UPI001378A894|nr:EAL domain-containing protein [Aquabacterium fontiphilum]NBD22072.1 EAL domain-containing protein [Aquabacterium fontiphilum]
MSLIRQIWLLLLATLLMAFVGSFAVWMWSARGYLETQLRLKNADNAQSLALNLSQQRGDVTAMELTVAAMFDTGFYQRITLKDAGGRVVVDREMDARVLPRQAPQWFVRMMPVQSAPGVAQVSNGWRAVGSVEVVSHSSFAHAQLWQGAIQTAGWLGVLGALSGLVASWGVARIRRPLDGVVGQAQALMDRRFVTLPEPKVPELARLGGAMNTMVVRLKALFDEQAAQVELLRQQAHCDPLTGLSHRRHFMAQLTALLDSEERATHGALYLIRVLDLTGINRTLGHRHTDALLQRIAKALGEVSSGVTVSALGRLNGGDFAVCLAGGDVPLPEAQHYADALRRAFAEHAVQGGVVVGAVAWRRGMRMHQLLAAADSALALAESKGVFSVEQALSPTDQTPVRGEDEWRRVLHAALMERRVQLGAFPVVDAQRRLVHMECPMRLQLDEAGEPVSAAHWLPMAMRTGLTSQIDELAVVLALEGMAQDHASRGVNVSPASLLDSSFVPRLRDHLLESPQLASRLWLEVAEPAAIERPDLVHELCQQLRPLGVRVGLEHAGERLTRVEALFEVGLDYIKLDAAVVQGVAQDASRAAFVTATASMLHGLGLQVYAEGVNDAADMSALWQCGVDGVTGPAVRLAS